MQLGHHYFITSALRSPRINIRMGSNQIEIQFSFVESWWFHDKNQIQLFEEIIAMNVLELHIILFAYSLPFSFLVAEPFVSHICSFFAENSQRTFLYIWHTEFICVHQSNWEMEMTWRCSVRKQKWCDGNTDKER